MNDETRYARQKRTEEQKARHAAIVDQLSRPIEERFDEWVDQNRPPCVKAGLPSAWTDWATNPEYREDYESDAPTKQGAEKLCKDCPIRAVDLGGNGLCLDYAKATGQSHGVWGGKVREIDPETVRSNGAWLYTDKEAHTARRIDND